MEFFLPYHAPTPRGAELFSQSRNRSQKKRRKIARRIGRKPRRRMAFNCHTLLGRGYNVLDLEQLQQDRLERKNRRRAENGLPPLKTYADL